MRHRRASQLAPRTDHCNPRRSTFRERLRTQGANAARNWDWSRPTRIAGPLSRVRRAATLLARGAARQPRANRAAWMTDTHVMGSASFGASLVGPSNDALREGSAEQNPSLRAGGAHACSLTHRRYCRTVTGDFPMRKVSTSHVRRTRPVAVPSTTSPPAIDTDSGMASAGARRRGASELLVQPTSERNAATTAMEPVSGVFIMILLLRRHNSENRCRRPSSNAEPSRPHRSAYP